MRQSVIFITQYDNDYFLMRHPTTAVNLFHWMVFSWRTEIFSEYHNRVLACGGIYIYIFVIQNTPMRLVISSKHWQRCYNIRDKIPNVFTNPSRKRNFRSDCKSLEYILVSQSIVIINGTWKIIHENVFEFKRYLFIFFFFFVFDPRYWYLSYQWYYAREWNIVLLRPCVYL